MKLLFLGSGSAFTIGRDNYHSNLLLIAEDQQKLLIDCGSDIRFSLYEQEFSYRDITDIYISHLHGDHVGGLEYIGLSSQFDQELSKPNLYLSQEISQKIWENTLAGGMESIEGKLMTLDSYFEVHSVDQEGYFTWQGINFYLIKVRHVDNGHYMMPACGLFFTLNQTHIFFTSDTQFCPDDLNPYYEKANLIFQDCEISAHSSLVHAHYHDLKTLPKSIKQKMWLYGYQPKGLPDAIADGFLGFVKKGQCFDF